MMKARYELAQIISAKWKSIEQSVKNMLLNTWQLRTLSALAKCRTAALGGHIDGCTHCGNLRISYNSCRNRHCPKCQGAERENWIQARENELLPVAYFHVVFTLPSELNQLCMHHPKLMYSSLFDAAWDTIDTFAKDQNHLGATTGMIAILHTWGQQLTLHPHLHCIIPAGGLTQHKKWKHCKTKGNYLFPVKAMSVVFRAKYVQQLRQHIISYNLQADTPIEWPKQTIDNCFKKPWVVFAKKPFSGVNSAVEYLGRYTHKIAISNHRIKEIDEQNDTVTFSYKDYKQGGKKKELTLKSMEFISRFSQHILPKRFVRIRHYGILSSTSKKQSIATIRKQLPIKKQKLKSTKAKIYNPLKCKCCNKETMKQLVSFDRRGPPESWLQKLKQQQEKKQRMKHK
jgi:Putative transposase/Transposase zinc-binding domain